MMSIKYPLVLILLFGFILAQAQGFEIKSTHDLDAQPEWVQLMYQENADPELVHEAYDAYYKQHDFVKNIHTQYYKRWQQNISRDDTGWFASGGKMTPAKLRSKQAKYLAKSKVLQEQEGPNSEWECIGPFDFDKESVSRSYAAGSAHVFTVEQSISNPNILYAGTATAGVFKSINKGLNWSLVTKNMAVKKVVSIEIDFLNPDIAYFESSGILYKTTDGGTTWNPIGDAAFQANSHVIADIVMSPTNTQSIFLCAKDGLYHTADAGNTWTQQMGGSFQELTFKPNNPNTIYAVRNIGNATEFFKSTDGGNNWTLKNNNGWPTVAAGEEQKRTELAVSPAAPNKVFALATGVANGGSGLFGVYVSSDSGENWIFQCCGPQPAGAPSANNINMMGWADTGLDDGGQFYYDLSFAVDPNNADNIHVGGVNHWVSTDGGISFTCPSKWSHVDKVNYIHADIHDIHFYGNDLWFACDGGVFYSNDGGATINRRQLGIAGTDFWGFGIGLTDSEVIIGGTYHNGTLLKDHNVYTNGWISTVGGDNSRGYVNAGDPRLVYADFGQKRLSGDRNTHFEDVPLLLRPNKSSHPGKSSNLEFFPDNYHSFYLGNEETLWKTTNNGVSFSAVHTFAGTVAKIRIAWSDPDIIYCTTVSPKKVWKTTDAGTTWTDITPSNNSKVYDIAVSNSDANKIWASRLGTSNANRIFYSDDAGASWTNITGNGMPNEKVTNIVCQQGTNGGLYVGTKRAVYYKNLQMNDWVLFNNGLPVSTNSTKLIPNYLSGKLFNGTNRSAYKVDFYEPSSVLAQISSDVSTVLCTGGEVQFVSQSVVSANATYAWSFPGGTPSTSTKKDPLIQFGTEGQFDVTLTVTDGGVSHTQNKVQMITVESNCGPDENPGNALLCTDGKNDFAIIEPLDLNTNTITFSAWIKRNGDQNNSTGILFCRGGSTTAGLNFKSNTNNLAYHWNSGEYNWQSGLTVPDDEWTHVALVVEPTKATIYLNGIPSIHNTNHSTEAFDASFMIGGEPKFNRKFKGQIDEVCIFDYALSLDEIRASMHLTKPENTPGLIHYYQFNRPDGVATDRVGSNHAVLAGNATRVESTGPFGGGVSHQKNVIAGGTYAFDNTDLSITFPNGAIYPDGHLVVSKINQAPKFSVVNLTPANTYWVIHNYGNNTTFSELSNIEFSGLSGIASTGYELYKRSSNADGDTWGKFIDVADASTSTSLTFESGNSITSFSQFAISSNFALPVELLSFRVQGSNKQARITWNATNEIDNNYFLLQRSKDGVSFSNLGRIDAKGSQNQMNSYLYVDDTPYKGISYYRLKQVDIGGQFSYSAIESLTMPSASKSVHVFPNPAGTDRSIHFIPSGLKKYTITIFNTQGQAIKTNQHLQGKTKLNLANLPAGKYFYQVRSAKDIFHGVIILE